MDVQELLGMLSAKWGRQLSPFYTEGDYPIYATYADEALVGFTCITDPPKIGEFNGQKCVLLPLVTWIMLNTLANQTVTPFRLVAVGKSIITRGWRPLTGLKYAVRNTEHGAMLHIPISDLKELS